mgnify:CR=1 FL=1
MTSFETAISVSGNNTIIHLHVQPSASKTAIRGMHGNRIKIAVKAPPIDGKANKALIEFFATALNVKKNKISIISGEKSREKTLRFENFSKETFLNCLKSLG